MLEARGDQVQPQCRGHGAMTARSAAGSREDLSLDFLRGARARRHRGGQRVVVPTSGNCSTYKEGGNTSLLQHAQSNIARFSLPLIAKNIIGDERDDQPDSG